MIRLARLSAAGLLAASIILAAGCSSDSESSTPATEACQVTASHCPNVCVHGSGVQGEACTGPTDCGCGLFCKGGECQPYEDGLAGCSCSAKTTDVSTSPDASSPDAASPDAASPDTADLDQCPKPTPDGAPCNPYCQRGCDDTGSCTIVGGSLTCSTSADKAQGDACASSEECAHGNACFAVNGGDAQCYTFCIDDQTCTGGRQCDLNVVFDSGSTFNFCGDVVVPCDVFDSPTTCPDGQSCTFVNSDMRCAPKPASPLSSGTACSGINPCEDGLQCLIACTPICSLSGSKQPACSDACTAGTEAIAASSADDIGVCTTASPPSQCDILEQSGCSSGMSCYTATTGFACFASGSIPIGTACGTSNDCVAGALCADSVCREVCSLAADAPSTHACDQKCTAESRPVTPTIWEIGVCVTE
ncbi:MAG: hypothetical protein ACI9OJ_002245 [Myxococcota bacterium]|jgi:hypothetical protein